MAPLPEILKKLNLNNDAIHVMSNSTSLSKEASVSSVTRVPDFGSLINPMVHNSHDEQPHKIKKKRNLPGNPDPDAEVIALSPESLLAKNRFVCEICNKGFMRDQNLQLHRRGHNLPWKLKQRSAGEEFKKKAYVCPVPTCVHHHPSRALGDLTGIKKHFCRKHGEKKWKCEKCSKLYAVQSDWKAHSKICGAKEYRCDCGTIFTRKDSLISHRAFCDALSEESARLTAATNPNNTTTTLPNFQYFNHQNPIPWIPPPQYPNPNSHIRLKPEKLCIPQYQERSLMSTPPYGNRHAGSSLPPLSATALLQRSVSMAAGHGSTTAAHADHMHVAATWQKNDHFTRDFLGLNGGGSGSGSVMELLSGGVEFSRAYDRDD